MNGPSQDYDRVELVWPGKRTEVVGRPILGGLHHEYERLAA